MKLPLLSRTLHKWLGLFVGLQLVLWTLSGFYMVVVDLDFIHGDPLVRNLRLPLQADAAKVGFGELSRGQSGIQQMSLRSLPGFAAPVYEITANGRKTLVDAASGRQLSPLPQDRVEALARAYYAGSGQLAGVTHITSNPPSEIQSRPLPLWRADFDDWLETSLYIHPDSGVLVTRRHRFWRWFDFLWMFHIMDYEAREDMNNNLLRVSTVLGLITVASGVWLLYFTFRRKRPANA